MPESDRRPRLTPAVADVRRAVREATADLPEGALLLVALSGGPDSLALAAATAFEAPRAGPRGGPRSVYGTSSIGARPAAPAARRGARP